MKKVILTAMAALLLTSSVAIPAAEARHHNKWRNPYYGYGAYGGYYNGYYPRERSHLGSKIGWGLAGLGIGLGLGALAGSRVHTRYDAYDTAPLNVYQGYPSTYTSSYGDPYWY